jgi:hypothetical protein
MQTLLAVLDDLFQFLRATVFGVRMRSSHEDELHLDAMQRTLPLSHQKDSSTLSMFTPSDSFDAVNGNLYFIGQTDVAFHTDPVVAFDVISSFIPYGEQVRVLKLGGRWAFIRWRENEGWIFKDALRDQAKDVFPIFEENVLYDAIHNETQKLRLCIDDAFCGARASLLLTDAEYVTYKLYQKGVALPWGNERPRISGTWQKKLRGKKGVYISVNPKASSVMEYVVDDVGYVAFVEAVFPDGTIKLTAIGSMEDGMYSEVLLPREQYRELRPVFLSVNY